MSGPAPRPWYWRSRGVWCAQVRGRRVILARGRESRAQAEAALYRHLAALGEAEPRSDLTLAEILDLWLDHSHAAHARGTYETHLAICRVIARAIGSVRVRALTQGHVDRFLASRRVSVATRRAYAVRIRSALAWARREGLVPATINPLAGWRLPPVTRRLRTLATEERAALREAASPALRPVLDLLTETGARPHILLGLTADSIDWVAGIAEATSKRRPYTLYLTQHALAILRPLAQQHASGPLLRNSRG